MARLIPKINPDEIENSGERMLAKSLISQLGAEVEVYHSFRWLAESQKGTLHEGECDFVVLDPSNGLLFIEVKGGTLRYVQEKDGWERLLEDGRKHILKKSPFDQCSRNMFTLLERIQKERPFIGLKELPFTFGYAVAFPHSRYEGTLPMGIHRDLLLDDSKCEDLKRAIQAIFDRWRRQTHPPMRTTEMDGVRSALFPKFGILPILWRQVEDQEERLRRLTDMQRQLLEFMSQRSLAAISGVAGSGKTILAMAKAQELARNGMRTLFLCFNKPLKDWIKKVMQDDADDNLMVNNYHGLALHLCQKAGIEFWNDEEGETPSSFWDEDVPDRLMNAMSVLGEEDKFDAIVVDEGQDFRDLWWASMDSLFRDPGNKGCYYVFFDSKQNIFATNASLPSELGEPFNLPVNCRNTVKIAKHCADLIEIEPSVRDNAPLGDDPEILQSKDFKEGFRVAAKKVNEWCQAGKGGLKPSQVAVLAPGSQKRNCPDKFGSVPMTGKFEKWRDDQGVLFSSAKRFKGLEADAVVILCVPSDEPDDLMEQYVARSRAKHILVVVEVTEPGE
jgi:hypothetical protein